MGGMGMGGGMMGGGSGGDMGGAGGGMGGGGGRGGKVDLSGAMKMIPKPISMPAPKSLSQLEGGIQPIQPSRPMPPDAGGGNSLSQMIMQFLQG
jgi:hypothetical protein